MSKYGDILDSEPASPSDSQQLDAVETKTTGGSASRYGALLDSDESADTGMVFSGTQKDPARALEATRLGTKLNVPPSVVESDVNRFKQEEKQADWKRTLKAHPELSDVLSRNGLIDRVNDDANNVMDVGKTLKEKGFRRASEELRKAQDAQQNDAAVREIVRMTDLEYKPAQTMLGSLRVMADKMRAQGADEKAINSAVSSHIMKFGRASVRANTKYENFVRDNPNVSALISGTAKFTAGAYGAASALQQATAKPTEGVFDAGSMTNYLTEIGNRFETAMMQSSFAEARSQGKALEWLGTQVLANAPSTAISLGGMLRPEYAHQILGVLATTSGGSQYQELRAQGYDQSVALSAAVAYGWLEQAFERQPIDIANALRNEWASLPVELRQNYGNRLLQAFTTAAAISGTNAAEEWGTQVSQNIVDVLSANLQENVGDTTEYTQREGGKSIFDGALDALMSGAASGSVQSPIVAAQQFMMSEQDAARIVMESDLQAALAAQHNAETVEEIVARVNQSETVKRGDAEGYAQLLQRMAADTGVENVFVPASEAAQLADIETLKRMFPSVASGIEQAAIDGRRVEIPLAEFVMATREGDIGEALRRIAATELNGMSAAEAQTFFDNESELLQKTVERVAEQAKDIDATRAEMTAVRKLVEEQFAGVRMFTRTAQRYYTDQRMAFYATMAERAGVSVQEMYDRYPLRLRTADTQQPEQSAYAQPDGDGGVQGDEDGLVSFVHWSDREGLTEIDPERFGTGAAGAEKLRRDQDPANWVNRTSVAIADGGYKRESQLGQKRYTGRVPAKSLYDFVKDPLGLRAAAMRESAAAPAGSVNPTSAYERMIRDAGFKGYVVDHPQLSKVAQLFDASDVQQTAPNEYAQRLENAPYVVDVDGQTIEFAPFEKAEQAAREYMARAGLQYNPPTIYTKVDEDRARRIADEFAKMKHDPENPDVLAAYTQMMAETVEQYRVVMETGLKVEFVPSGQPDPYGNPRNAMLDVINNNHLWVFSTRDGFGTDATFDQRENPLLAESEFEISGQSALVNDIFRVVHDYFGHIKDGVGFRASGEENAWRSHWAMYSPLARKAMTTETRGQNSWLNFGPKGDKNRTAKTEETFFADQKVGLLPDWVVNDGATDADVMNSKEYAQATAPMFYSALIKGVEKIKAKALAPDGWKAELKGLVNKQQAKQAEIDATGIIDWLDMQNVEVDGVVPKISKEQMQKSLEMSVVQIEEVLYGGDDSDFSLEERIEERIDIGEFETETPDPNWIEEIARDNYYDEILDRLKADNEDELAEGEVTVEELEEKALENAIELAEQGYWDDSDSPSSAIATVEAEGKTFRFTVGYSYGEKSVYSHDKGDYIGDLNWRSDEDDIRRVISEYIADEGYSSVSDSVAGIDGPTKFHDYSSGKGTDYRELLLTIPSRTSDEGGNYKSSHWDDATNPVAHVRFTTRTDRDGKPVLFVEEIQSDWAQEGRERGFDKVDIDTTGWTVKRINYESTSYVEVRDAKGELVYDFTFSVDWVLRLKDGGQIFKRFSSESEARAALVGQPELELSKAGDRRDGDDEYLISRAAEALRSRGVPSAPFVENTDAWVMLVLKRVIRWAAENGMNEVALIGGQESADRYRLTKYISKIKAESFEQGYKLRVQAFDTAGRRVMDSSFKSVDDPELSRTVGKAMADEIAKSNGVGEWTGLNIKSGGEGMMFFYGDEGGAGVGKKPDGTPSVVAKNVSKLLKQLGGEGLKTVRLYDKQSEPSYFIRRDPTSGYYTVRMDGETVFANPDRAKAEAFIRDSEEFNKPYLGFEITEKMRDTVMNVGLPLFQTDRRGSYSPDTGIIKLTQAADLSTFLHESGHQYLDIMFDLASRPDAAQGIVADVQTLFAWMGVESFDAWRGMSIDQRRPHHEKFAEGFEQYLFEGKAPSNRLREAFAAFSRWLVRIYRELRNDLTPEVRSVFDRMLASNEEINRAREAAGKALFKSAAEAGMDDETWLNYKADEREAISDAVEQHQRRRLRDMKWLDNAKGRELRRLQREAAGVRRGVRDDVEKEVRAMPVYMAIDFIKNGKTRTEDGEEIQVEAGHKLNTEALTVMFPPRETGAFDWRTKLRGMHSADGLHPDMVAAIFGYQSGDELVRALMNAQPMKEVVAARTDQRMLEEHSELADEQAIEDSANAALHNDAHLKFLATEHAALANLAKARRVPAGAIREAAERLIGATKVDDIKPHVYSQAERRAAKAAEDAVRKGDYVAALEANRVQLVNATLVKLAYEAKSDVDKRIAAMRKAFASDKRLAKTRDMNLVNAARALIDAYDVAGSAANPMSYLDKVKAYDPEMYNILSEAVAPHLLGAKQTGLLTLDEFKGLSDVIAQLWHLSRRSKQIEIDGKLLNRADVVAQMREKMAEHESDKPRVGMSEDMRAIDRLKVIFQSWGSTLRRVESWVSMMDGGQRGPFRSYLWNPVRYGVEKYRTDVQKYLDEYRTLLKTLDMRGGAAIAAPEIGYTFTNGKASLLHAILHTGNESNKRKLLLGRGWGTVSEEGILDSSMFDGFVSRMIEEGVLTKADFDFAQGVWDLLEKMKPDAQRAHKTVYGYYFDEITAEPFSNKFGDYRGGYVPALTDSFLVADAAVNEAAENLVGEGSFMWPSTGAGFTKGRVENYTKPLTLDLRMIGAHIDKALRFTHVQPPVQDVARLLRSNGIRSGMESVDITAIPDMLLPWLRRAASQVIDTPPNTKFNAASGRFFKWARSTTGMTIMFANVVNTLQQLTGFSIAALRANPVSLAKALMHVTLHPAASNKFVGGSSMFMKNRNATQVMDIQSDIKKIVINPNLAKQGTDFVRRHAYFMQSAFQNFVDNVTWLAAYREATDKSGHDEAVRIADSAVRETQGSFSPEDVSAIEEGTPMYRMFMMFAGYFNMQANILTTEFKNAVRQSGLRHGYGRLVYTYIFGFAIPAVVAEAIVQAFQPADDGDDDESYVVEAVDALIMPQVRTALAMVPGVGMLATTALNRFDDKWYNDRLTISPVVSVGDKAFGGAKALLTGELFDEDVKKSEVKDFMTLMAVMSGLPPIAAASKPVGYLMDVERGEAEPENPVDFARGLVTGR